MIIKPDKKEKTKPTAKKLNKKETNKTTTKIQPPKKTSDDSKKVYHVSKREDGKWQVKFAGGEKAIKLFKTQKEALEYSKEMTKNQKGALLVHNSKGKNKGRIKSK